MTVETEAAASLRWVREAYQSTGDETGVHLCDLALVMEAGAMGPAAVLRAVAAPLRRMAAAGSVFGVDVLGAELLLAALELGHEELQASISQLVARSGRAEIVGQVVERVLVAASEREVAGARAEAIRYGEAGLELSVAGGHFEGGAASLLLLAELHGSAGRADVARLCRRQAVAYLERAGLGEQAAEQRLVLAIDAPAADATGDLLIAAGALESGGDAERAVELWLSAAAGELDKQQARAVVAGLRRAAESDLAMEDAQLEARIWRALAGVHGALGDDAMAASCRGRAELMAPADPDVL